MAQRMRLDSKVEKAIIDTSRQLGNMNRIAATVARVLFGKRIKEIKDDEKEFRKVVEKRRDGVARFI